MTGQPIRVAATPILSSMIIYLAVLPFIQYPITTILKPIPILLLMIWAQQATPKRHEKILLLFALGCSMLGDIVLTLPMNGALHVGILAFMATHCTYIILFLKNSRFTWTRFVLFLPVLAVVIYALYLLWPYLGGLKIPVSVYICLLSLMVFSSFQVKQYALITGLGALLFSLSDFILALTLFVLPGTKPTALVIMLLYYTAQFLLVTGISKQRGTTPGHEAVESSTVYLA